MKLTAIFSMIAATCLLPLQAEEELHGAAALMGEPLNKGKTLDATEVFDTIRQLWISEPDEDYRNNSYFAEVDAQPAYDALNQYLHAAKTAYAAQMEYAQYSLSAIKTEHPQRYETALQLYNNALLLLYLQDMRIISRQQDAPQAPPVYAAMYKRAALTDSGAGYRNFMGATDDFVLAEYDIKIKTLAELIDGESERYPGPTEFITGTILCDINCPPNYAATCRQKFENAESAWLEYAELAAEMENPLPCTHGTDTGIFIMSLKHELIRNHEKFLGLLMHGLK